MGKAKQLAPGWVNRTGLDVHAQGAAAGSGDMAECDDEMGCHIVARACRG
jgi:hypothetical protein